MKRLFNLLFLSSLTLTLTVCIAVTSEQGEQSIELLNLCETNDDVLQAKSHSELPLAVSLNAENLNSVSSSILLAETWLKSNVLAHYPAAKITNIVAKNYVFCQQNQKQNLVVVLSALKNVYHSLKRWGLEKEIKVSFAFHLDCFTLNSASYKNDFKTVMEFLQSVNSTFSLIPHEGFSHFSHKSLNLVSSHIDSMKKLGFFHFSNIVNVAANIVPKERKTTIARKLSVLDSSFPVRPTPMPKIAEPPKDIPVGYPSPSNVPTNKNLPPLAQIVSSPPPIFSPTFTPQEQPPQFIVPASSPSPHGFTLPPCNPPIDNGSPYPQITPIQKLWCVAKPSVPEETLQQALDYACGEGGADCNEITPQGNCYNPDTVFAHASYAFNSYWQKHKRNGGTCDFGGTAMLINSDPSFLQCRFVLT